MTRTHSLHATTREWVDESGKRHKVRIEVGAIFRSKAGNLVVKMDAVPITKDWSGYLAAEQCAPALPPGRRASAGMPPPPRKRPVELELTPEQSEILRDFGPNCCIAVVPSAADAPPGTITLRLSVP